MPSFSFNNIAFTGKMVFAPLIKGASFVISQYARMTKSATADLYGTSVAATATELAVGAPGPTSPATGTGKVFLYARDGDDWVDLATITGPSTNKLGQAVDINSEWLVASANGGNGTVYVYRKVAGVWGTTPFQTITPTESGAGFGYSLSISGTSLAIGHRDGNGGNGAVQVWVFDGTTWNKQATIVMSTVPLVAAGQRIGWSVFLVGDMLVSGGPGSAAAIGNGVTIVSTRTSTNWSTPTTLLSTGGGTTNGFGSSVTINNGKIIVGAAGQNAVYIFTGAGSTWTLSAKLDVGTTGVIVDGTAGTASARVGWSVSVTTNGNVVIAGGYNNTSAVGTSYVFENVDGVWGPSATSLGGISRLAPTPATTNQRFAWSQTMSGNQLIVGGTGNGSSVAGAVYTFK